MSEPIPDKDAASVSNRLAAALHAIGTLVFIPALMLLVGVDVVLRYFFDAPLSWSVDAGGLLLLTVFLCSLPSATVTGHHVRMELFYLRTTGVARRIADAVSALGGLSLSLLLTYQSVVSAWEMYRFDERPVYLDVPYWPFSVVMAASALFLCVHYFHQLVVPPSAVPTAPPAL